MPQEGTKALMMTQRTIVAETIDICVPLKMRMIEIP